MSIGSGVLLLGVVEIPPFPILRPLAYTTGLGYRPTCDKTFRNMFYFICNRDLMSIKYTIIIKKLNVKFVVYVYIGYVQSNDNFCDTSALF